MKESKLSDQFGEIDTDLRILIKTKSKRLPMSTSYSKTISQARNLVKNVTAKNPKFEGIKNLKSSYHQELKLMNQNHKRTIQLIGPWQNQKLEVRGRGIKIRLITPLPLKNKKNDEENSNGLKNYFNVEEKSKSEKSKSDKSTSERSDKKREKIVKLRHTCQRLLANALRGEEKFPKIKIKSPEILAMKIEKLIFKKHNITNDTTKYQTEIRSKIFNLKDKNNPSLCKYVLCGKISAKKFAKMTSAEMSSEKLKKQREKIVNQSIKDSTISKSSYQGTKSTNLKCSNCGQKNCQITEVQTRSANRPMTNIIICDDCGMRSNCI